MIWLALTGLAALVWRAPAGRVALRLLALSICWAPAILLVLAAPDAGPLASALAVGLGAPALALITDRALSACAGLALAAGVTVAAYAIDVVAGSPLTSLSVLGPNPGAGVRFFGIGNELEAILTTLALIGCGAWLQTRAGIEPRRAALWFVGVAVVAAAAFAPGRFGADVGAAIVLGVGGATAAVVALGLERRRAILIVAGGGTAALAALLVIDAALGGAHLSRTVLGAGEAGDVLDVFDRRITLMVHTFTHPVYPELLVVCGALLIAGAVRRRRVDAWFGGRWAARAGYLGAVAGVLLGTVANDSGSVLLVIGTIYLAIGAGFYWATQGENRATNA
jgi:cell division protein FtsW (lipid II flippase)